MKALICSGGGSKGIFQVSVLRVLLDNNPDLDYDIYSGISAGSLNSALLATGPLKETLPQLEKIWLEEVKGNHSIWHHHLWRYILCGICLIVLFVTCAFISFIFDANKLITIVFILLSLCSLYVPFFSLKRTKSIYKTEPLRNLVEKHLDVEKLKTSGKKLRVGAVSYETGEYRSGKETDDNIIDWIMASSAFPIFFPMVEIDGQHWTDGGIINIASLYDAINLGATEIDIIVCSSLDAGSQSKLGLPTQFERTLDIMSSEILSNDIMLCKSHANVRIFMPFKNLGVSSLSFDPEKIKNMYEIGKETAAKILSNAEK